MDDTSQTMPATLESAARIEHANRERSMAADERLRCPFCEVTMPSWAGRAQWEHVDSAHRDDGPADTAWLSEADLDPATCTNLLAGRPDYVCGAPATWEGVTPRGHRARRCADHPPYAMLLTVTGGGRAL